MEVKATGGQRAASQSLIALEPKWRAGARTATGVKNARVDKSGCSIVEIEGGRVLRAVYVALIFCLFLHHRVFVFALDGAYAYVALLI